MKKQVPAYPDNDSQLLFYLWIAILLLFGIALLFFTLTFLKRLRKIRQTALKNKYQQVIDNALFSYLFNGDTSSDILQLNMRKKTKLANYLLFQKVAIKAITALHKNYSGEYKRKLELLYVESGLVHYSLRKLKSKRWPKVVEGIRDLTSLNYQKAYPEIEASLGHRHPMVQTEALIGIIRLKGLDDLVRHSHLSIYLNDWVQSNILYAVKINHIEQPENLGELLNSKNTSIVLLGVRLIDQFQAASYIDHVFRLKEETNDPNLKKEYGNTVARLTTYLNASL